MCAPEKQFFHWDRSPKSISLGYRHQPVADIRLPAAEGGCNRCVWIYVAMNAQPREVDWGLRVFNQSAARTHTGISCNRTEAPTPFPLATRGDSSWRFRQTAPGARGRASGHFPLRICVALIRYCTPRAANRCKRCGHRARNFCTWFQ